MIDAEDAIEQAAFAALSVPAIAALATVYQHVPEDTPPPVLIIGDMDSDGSIAAKDDGDEQVALTITAVIAGEERRPLRAIKRQVKVALHGLTVTVDNWRLQFNFTGSDGLFIPSGSPDDQDSYIANYRFSVIALGQS
jgi:hypothetical protein